jgi:hypothetical protein
MRIRPVHLLYGLAIVVASFFITLWTMNYFSPLCPRGEMTALKGPFSKQGTFSFFAAVSSLSGSSDAPDAPNRSTYLLCEDSRPLGPAHTPHGDIATKGGGRFSHFGPGFYFSSSDNSDPNSNGRNYWAIRPQ